MAQLLSIQVGQVKTHILPDGTEWTTAYFKEPVAGHVFIGEEYVEGDAQQHKRFHGGVHRSVLGYSADHYIRWQEELGVTFPYGAFGENFSILGQDENTVCIGDIYAVGDEVRLQVSAPREPCNQIDKRWNMPDLRRRVAQTLRTGWYMRTLQTGRAQAGLPVTLLERPYPQWTVRQAQEVRLRMFSDPDAAVRLAACEALEPGWRRKLLSAV
jgi:MOSC domain-containing protein YiiM